MVSTKVFEEHGKPLNFKMIFFSQDASSYCLASEEDN